MEKSNSIIGIDVVQILILGASAIEPSKYDEFSWKYMELKFGELFKEKYPHIHSNYVPKRNSSILDKSLWNFDVFGVIGNSNGTCKRKTWLNMFFKNMEPCRLYSKKNYNV